MKKLILYFSLGLLLMQLIACGSSTNSGSSSTTPVTNAYITSCDTHSILHYKVGNNSNLTYVESTALSDCPNGIALANGYAYVALYNENAIVKLKQNSDGSLTNTLESYATGNSPDGIQVQGAYLYVVNNQDNSIWKYSIASNGTLTYSNESYITGNYPSGLTFNNKFAYVTNNWDNTIWIYRVDNRGNLNYTGESIATGSGPFGIITYSNVLYVVNGQNETMWKYTIANNGSLTYTNESFVIGLGGGPGNGFAIGIAINNNQLFIADYAYNTTWQYSINSNGSINVNSVFGYPITNPWNIAFK